MDRTRVKHLRFVGSLAMWAVLLISGCQTVRTPEDKIAKSNIPREFNKVSMPEYVVEPPDLIVVEVLEALPGRPIQGERLVRPDGKITLGFYGEVFVAGLPLPEVKEKIILHLRKYLNDEVLGLVGFDEETGDPKDIEPVESDRVFVDIAAYNSKAYYVSGDVGSPGRLPITGNETVLDAIIYAGGLIPTAANQNIRLVRPAPPGACCEQLLPVNLAAIINGGDSTTNYQLMPGDRVVVYRDPIVRTTIFLDRLAAPFQTVNNNILNFAITKRQVEFLKVPVASQFGGGGAATTGNRGRVTTILPGAR